MSKVYTLGLSKIEMGAIAEGGGMGSTLTQIGDTLQDSCSLSQDDPEVTEFYSEESDDPVLETGKPGVIKFSWKMMNPDVAALATVMGGTANTESGTWEAPSEYETIEKSVRITPRQGYVIDVPRMKLSAKINGELSKKNLFVIEIVGTVMKPTDNTAKKITFTKIA